MQIITTATAFPPHYFLQETVVEALKGQWEGGLENAAVLERLHSRTGVAGRYFSLPLEQYPPLDTWGKTNDVWIETAERLGAQAIECVLSKSGVDRKQIGALYFVSVTGVSSPSVDARLVNRMSLSPQIKRNPIFGLGCVAGAAGLARSPGDATETEDGVALDLRGKTHPVDQPGIHRGAGYSGYGDEIERADLLAVHTGFAEHAFNRLRTQSFRGLDPDVVGFAPGV